MHSTFETELSVRPNDVDMNQHVHSSRYRDHVLAARYDQMERCYNMSMDEFIKLGYGWVISAAFMQHKRPLGMSEK
ncbi:MAG: thioesterase [Ignavibacteriales bacterium]|nr:thioesterase [Ignavibacteriales bacterium]